MPRQASRLAVLVTLFLLTTACAPSAPAATPTLIPPPTEPPPTITPIPPTPTPRPTATPQPTPTPYPTFRDEFISGLLEGWSWIRERPTRWSLTSNPGYLTITLEGGAFHRNLLVRDAPSPNFEITTHVLFTPKSNFQFAGLLVYDSDESMATFGRAFCNISGPCKGNAIYFDNLQDGQFASSNFATTTKSLDQAYLRIVKIGTTLTGSYSEDGKSWKTIGEQYIHMETPRVGLMAGQSNVVGAEAMFDYFELVELP